MSQFQKSAAQESLIVEPISPGEQAERCFRLARTIDDEAVILKLLALGRRYVEQDGSNKAASEVGERILENSSRVITGKS